jgi:hypothetical protein
MDKDLYKVANNHWVVAIKNELIDFSDVDAACDHIEQVGGVPPEDVEAALIDMAIKNNRHASFDTLDGSFAFSDNELPEYIGGTE